MISINCDQWFTKCDVADRLEAWGRSKGVEVVDEDGLDVVETWNVTANTVKTPFEVRDQRFSRAVYFSSSVTRHNPSVFLCVQDVARVAVVRESPPEPEIAKWRAMLRTSHDSSSS